MTKYFDPIKFPELEPKEKPKEEISTDLDLRDISACIVEINRLLNSIHNGDSDLIRRAVQITAKGAVRTALKRLEEFPTKKNLRSFIALTKQDISARVAKELFMIMQHADKELRQYLINLGEIDDDRSAL